MIDSQLDSKSSHESAEHVGSGGGPAAARVCTASATCSRRHSLSRRNSIPDFGVDRGAGSDAYKAYARGNVKSAEVASNILESSR